MYSRLLAVGLATALAPVAKAYGSSWRPLPVWGGGYMQEVAFAPSDRNVLYAYADVGGPYRSDDRGRTWRALHANMPHDLRMRRVDRVRSFSVDPRNADSFVLAGGDNPYCPGGIAVSRDGGRTFRRSLVARFYGNDQRRRLGNVLDRDPFAPDNLVAAADCDGVFTSTDGGNTWTSRGLDNHLFCEVKYDRAVRGRVYACAPALGSCPCDGGSTNRPPRGGRDSGFYRSEDGGATWRRLGEKSPCEIAQIVGDDRLVAIFNERNVVVSANGGETWMAFDDGLHNVDNADAALRFDVLSAGTDFWVVGDATGRLWRRGICDAAWAVVPVSSWRPGDPQCETFLAIKKHAENPSSLVVDPEDSLHWFMTDWFSVMESSNGGKDWTSAMRGIQPLCPFSIVCDPCSSDNISYGVADVGHFVSNDGGKSFALRFGCCNRTAFSFTKSGLALWVGGKLRQDIIRSRDGGRTMESPRLEGLPPLAPRACAAYTVAANPMDGCFWLCVSGENRPGMGGLYVSADAGDTWKREGNGLPEGEKLFADYEFAISVPQIVFSQDGSAVVLDLQGRLWWLDRTTNIWRSSNGNAKGVTDYDTHVGGTACVVSDPFRPGRFLVTHFKGFAVLHESLDGGQTFHPLDSGVGVFYSVAFDPHVKGRVYVGGRDEILVSSDGGAHFGTLPNGLALPSGTSRRLVADRGRLFFLTDGNGVWVRDVRW